MVVEHQIGTKFIASYDPSIRSMENEGREVEGDPLHIDTGSRLLLPFLRASQLHNEPGEAKKKKK